jgi:DDE_Tnp_1-associated
MDDGLNFTQVVVFFDHFKEFPGLRQRGKVMYPLNEILLLCLAAVLAGVGTVSDIARFGEKKLHFLRRFFCRLRMARPPTTIWATFWRRSTRMRSSAALFPGPPPGLALRRRPSPSSFS